MSGWLEGELAAVRGELGRVDGKCGVLTAIATGAAAFSVSQAAHGPLAARLALSAAGAVFAAAVLVLLWVLRPQFGPAGWCRYVQMPASDIEDLDRDGHTWSPVRVSAAGLAVEDLTVLSRLVQVKYRRMRWAIHLIGTGAVVLAAAIAAGVAG